METSRPSVRAAVDTTDLAALLSGAAARAPFLTVLLTTEGDVANAGPRDATRWRTWRDDAAARGVSDAVLAAIDARVADAHQHGAGLVVVADRDAVRLVEHLNEAPRVDRVDVGSLPRLAPIVAHRQTLVPYVVVLLDRRGADVVTVAAEPHDGERTHTDTTDAAAGPERKVAPGGWSQRRYQQRAENTWRETADNVADAVTRAVDHVGARLVTVAGDVREVELLRRALPAHVTAMLHVVEGGRAADGSDPVHSTEVRHLVTTVTADDTVAVLRRLDEDRGRGSAAVGAADTIAALARGQVDVLVVHDDDDDERIAFFGPEPLQLGLTRDDLAAMGVNADDVREGRLVDVTIRAALGASSAVRVVPAHGEHVVDGLAALERWS